MTKIQFCSPKLFLFRITKIFKDGSAFKNLKFERGFSSFAIVVAVPLPDLHESLMDYLEVSLLLSHTVDPYLEPHLNV